MPSEARGFPSTLNYSLPFGCLGYWPGGGVGKGTPPGPVGFPFSLIGNDSPFGERALPSGPIFKGWPSGPNGFPLLGSVFINSPSGPRGLPLGLNYGLPSGYFDITNYFPS